MKDKFFFICWSVGSKWKPLAMIFYTNSISVVVTRQLRMSLFSESNSFLVYLSYGRRTQSSSSSQRVHVHAVLCPSTSASVMILVAYITILSHQNALDTYHTLSFRVSDFLPLVLPVPYDPTSALYVYFVLTCCGFVNA